MSAVKNPPEDTPRVVPMLSYADAPAAIEFLCRAFGFTQRFRLDMPDGRVGHAELALHEGVVSLASEFEGFGTSPLRLDGHHAQLVVYVDDVDAHFARARQEGATIVAEPADQFYGDRNYRAVDPEGHRWIFATHVRDVPPEEMAPPAA
jgi:PhnB protein